MFQIDPERVVIAPDLVLRALENPSVLGANITIEQLLDLDYVKSVIETHHRLKSEGHSVLTHPFYVRSWQERFGTPKDIRENPYELETLLEGDKPLNDIIASQKLMSRAQKLKEIVQHPDSDKVPKVFPDCPPLDDSYNLPEEAALFLQAHSQTNEDSTEAGSPVDTNQQQPAQEIVHESRTYRVRMDWG